MPKIYSGIVLYNPDPKRLKQSLDSISCQVEKVILIDNGSANAAEVLKILSVYRNVVLVSNQGNLGIAAALNQICSLAYDESADWVLTLDQDTVCSPDIISKLSKQVDISSVGIVCPAVDYEGLHSEPLKETDLITTTYACMTSGSLTNLDAWKKVGGFREDYFIDYVDNEFCMKLGLHGYKIVRVHNCIMHHQLGEVKEKRILGLFKRRATTHSPLRYYYMTRNNLVFIWEYKRHLNVFKEYLKIAYILWHGLLYADNTKEMIEFIKRGVTDAKNRNMGKFSYS